MGGVGSLEHRDRPPGKTLQRNCVAIEGGGPLTWRVQPLGERGSHVGLVLPNVRS